MPQTIEDVVEMDSICQSIDDLTINMLILTSQNIENNIALEKAMEAGNYNLAKSRYVLGHKNVTSLQIPHETNVTAAIKVATDNDQRQIERVEADDSPTNPLRWFGILTPQSLRSAQKMFQNTVEYAIDCVNTRRELKLVCDNLSFLLKLKKELGGDVEE